VPGIFKIKYFGFFPVAKYLTKEALEGFGDSKTGGKVIRNVRYADDLVLLAKEETVLQGMIERLVENGRCYGTEVNVEKKEGNENLRATIPSTVYDRLKRAREYVIFKLIG